MKKKIEDEFARSFCGY